MTEANRDNTGKAKLSELHWFKHGLDALAEHMARGRAKYPDADGIPNWLLGGKPDSEYLDAIERHSGKLVRGETHDTEVDENGQPGLGTLHAAALAWNALALITNNQADLPVYVETDQPPPGQPVLFTDVINNHLSYDTIDSVDWYNTLSAFERRRARALGFREEIDGTATRAR